jgi:hypothetical protein
MDRFRLGRPSPAMVVAATALFVSLGGVSYGVATGSIDSREIKNNTVRSKDIRNNTIRGRDIRSGGVYGSDVHRATLTGSDVRNGSLRGADIRNNSLTGADILESSLGTVSSAGSARTAASATSAGRLSSQSKLSYQGATSSGSRTIFNSGKLRLTATCGAGAALTLRATTSVNNATLQSDGTTGAGGNDTDFDSAIAVTLSSASEERDAVYTEPGGQVVVVQYAAVEGGAYGGAQGCIVKGVAQTL